MLQHDCRVNVSSASSAIDKLSNLGQRSLLPVEDERRQASQSHQHHASQAKEHCMTGCSIDTSKHSFELPNDSAACMESTPSIQRSAINA